MLKSSKLKTLLFTTCISLFFATPVHAATYTVTAGDSLYKIGQLFNTSAGTIISTNKLSTSTIYPRQVLNVPAVTYTVQAGDSLYLIGKKYNISIDVIKKINNLWTNTIYIGQKLNLPLVSSVTAAAAITTSTGVYSQNDVDLLARLINAEAQGESYTAKVAVGAVVLNRLEDPRFPKSISAVIYEKYGPYYQFTPVLNGWINKPASQEAINAAIDALKGIDPTKGAVYYFDTTVTNTWLLSKPVAVKLGNLIFAY